MTIRVLVNGAQGKMGQQTVKTLSALVTDFTLVGQTRRDDDLAQEIKKSKAQIVIDFTNADTVYKNLKTILQMGVHPVIGTSGLRLEQIQELQEQSSKQKLGGIIAPNFSLGAVLMMKQAAEIAKYFPNIEIIEMHHPAKVDSPSGTAMRTAELLNAARINKPNIPQVLHETVPGARGAFYQDIPIHAVRLPGLLASQQILFGGLGETLSLRHDTLDRECFMSGLVFSCKKVFELDKLVYGLENLL